nr:hypothetical protein [uncultured Allomuricauda sp.]
MKTKYFWILLFSMILGQNTFAQFNAYKYIIVPKKFDGYKQENKHQTSTIIKYLLTQRGFHAVYDDALPEDLFKDRCLGLIVNLQDDSSFFTTKTTLVFKDCRSVEVFRTIEGSSKLKEFKPAYSQAIKRAFVSLDGIAYTYQPKSTNEVSQDGETVTLNFKNDVKTLKPKPEEVVLEQENTTENQTYKSVQPKEAMVNKVIDSNSKGSGAKTVVLEQEVTPDNQTYKAVEPKTALFSGEDEVGTNPTDLLYAQPVPNGYQLVDSSPKIICRLVETSVKDVYLVASENKTGIVFQKEGKWHREYLENGTRKVEVLNIKF